MARAVPVGAGAVKRIRRKHFKFWALLSICLLIVFSACGCASAPLEKSYDFSARSFDAISIEQGSRADAFARELCVVTDDSGDGDAAITAEAAGVFGIQTPRTIYSKNVLEKLYPASTTKIMTALIAIKYGNLSDEVTVTEEAVITESGATLCGIKPGDKLTLEQLFMD